MSHSAAHTGSGCHMPKTGPAKRPSSIAELADRAMEDLWDDSKDFKHYLRVAEKYRKDGKECTRRGVLEGAFVELARAATLVLEKLSMHRDYNFKLNANQRQNLALNSQDILDNLSDLKPAIIDRYKNGRTPNARTQKIANGESATRAQAQAQCESEARERRQIAAEEAVIWRQQREQMREAAATTARKVASIPPDYTFSRPPNAHGSQSTVVIADGRPPDEVTRQQQQWQKQMRSREEEILRRQAEQKRKQEQEATTPALSFFQSTPIKYPSAHLLTHQNSYRDPYATAPTTMPLENPTKI
ncbi:hypothetical protein BDZ97DRAFT_1832849 [Flammula alnicola]|nr:hypothetical protein BDZ97DRAFT_1832849 [Flammula alnicola]